MVLWLNIKHSSQFQIVLTLVSCSSISVKHRPVQMPWLTSNHLECCCTSISGYFQNKKHRLSLQEADNKLLVWGDLETLLGLEQPQR